MPEGRKEHPTPYYSVKRHLSDAFLILTSTQVFQKCYSHNQRAKRQVCLYSTFAALCIGYENNTSGPLDIDAHEYMYAASWKLTWAVHPSGRVIIQTLQYIIVTEGQYDTGSKGHAICPLNNTIKYLAPF